VASGVIKEAKLDFCLQGLNERETSCRLSVAQRDRFAVEV